MVRPALLSQLPRDPFPRHQSLPLLTPCAVGRSVRGSQLHRAVPPLIAIYLDGTEIMACNEPASS
jgi:hypothetical protein